MTGRCFRALTGSTRQQQQPSQLSTRSSRAVLQAAGRVIGEQFKASSSPRLQVVAAASQNGATADKPKVVVLGTGLMGEQLGL